MLDCQRLLKVLDRVQEYENLVAGPGCNVGRAGREVLLLPLMCQVVADIDEGGVEVGLRRKTGAEEAALPVDRRDLVLQARIFWGAEELKEGVSELVGVQRLVGPLAEVIRDELVEVLTPDEAVEVVNEVEALLVGHRAESIVRVYALVADAQLGELVVFPKLLNRLLW